MIEMFEKLKLLLNKSKEAPKGIDEILGNSETLTAIKPSKPKSDHDGFLTGFDTSTFIPKKPQLPKTLGLPEPEKIQRVDFVKEALPHTGKGLSNHEKKKLLSDSIMIMSDTRVISHELDLVGYSKINGNPIYRYIGKDFTNFVKSYPERQFEEVFYNYGS